MDVLAGLAEPTTYLYLAAAALSLPLFFYGVTQISSLFYFYLFGFPALYGVFLEIYVRITHVTESDLPFAVRTAKDFFLVFLLVCFVVWKVSQRVTIRFPGRVAVPLLIFVGYLGVQLLRTFAELGAFGSILAARNSFAYIPAIYIAAHVIKTQEDVVKAIKYMSYVMIAAGIYLVISAVFGLESRLFIIGENRPSWQYIVTSFFGDPNALALFSNMTFALVLCTRSLMGHKKLSWIALTFAAISVLASQSRIGFITFLLLLVFLTMFEVLRLRHLIILGIVSVVGLFLITPSFFVENRIVSSLFNDVRLVEWNYLLDTYFWREPIIGHGFGVFGFAALRVADLQGYVPRAIGVDNYYLTLALNTGIIGVVLFGLLLVGIFRLFVELIADAADPSMKRILIGLGMVLIVQLIGSFTTNYLESYGAGIYFWFAAGAICAVREFQYKSAPESNTFNTIAWDRKPYQEFHAW